MCITVCCAPFFLNCQGKSLRILLFCLFGLRKKKRFRTFRANHCRYFFFCLFGSRKKKKWFRTFSGSFSRNIEQNKMAENQMNNRTLRSSKTTIDDLYTDCLVSILAFVEPLEMWDQRLTCSHWHEAVPVALSRVTTYDFGIHTESHFVRRGVDLCPTLTLLKSRSTFCPLVKKV